MTEPGWGWAFTAAACLLAAAGIGLGLWAFFWDRPRGRRRCPKCWYETTGVPGLVCPECGREAKSERSLLRTRRHWRWAAVATIVLAGSYAAAVAPAVRAGGWPGAVPTTALIAALPWLEPPSAIPGLATPAPPLPPAAALYAELEKNRIAPDTLWGWQSRWLVRRCLSADARRPVGLASWKDAYGRLLRAIPSDRLTQAERDRRDEAEMCSVIVTRAHWPEGTPLRLLLQYSEHMRGDSHRTLLVTPTFDGGRACERRIYPRNTFVCYAVNIIADSTLEAGRPPAIADQLSFDMLLTHDNGRVVWRTSRNIPIRISGSIGDVLTPVRSREIDEHIRANIQIRGPYVSLPANQATQGVTFALRIELIESGTVRSFVRVWAGSGQYPWFWTADERASHRFASTVKGVLDPERWAVRIRSDPELALRDFANDLYWDGDVTIPLSDLLLRASKSPNQ